MGSANARRALGRRGPREETFAAPLPVLHQSRMRASRLWINHVLDRTMRSRVRSTRKKQEVFKWTQCMEDFVHGQLDARGVRVPPALVYHDDATRSGRRGWSQLRL